MLACFLLHAIPKTTQLCPLGHSLLLLALLLLALLFEVLLLTLGIKRGKLLVALSLLGLFALIVALLGLFLNVGLLDLLNRVLAHRLDLAQHLGAEVGLLSQLVRQADGVLEDGQQWGVVAVGGEAVLEEDALAGVGLLDTAEELH